MNYLLKETAPDKLLQEIGDGILLEEGIQLSGVQATGQQGIVRFNTLLGAAGISALGVLTPLLSFPISGFVTLGRIGFLTPPITPPAVIDALRFYVNGIEIGYVNNTYRFSDEMGARSTLSVQIVDPPLVLKPGQSVLLLDPEDEKLFAGSIDGTRCNLFGASLVYEIECVDHNQLTDRFIVHERYEQTTLSAIVEDLRVKYLTSDGVVAGDIQGNDVIIYPLVIDHWTLTEALNKLFDLSGYPWEIDYDKRLHMRPRGSLVVSTPVDAQSMTVVQSRGKYRNAQYLRAGEDETDPITEEFFGNSEQQTFSVGYPIAREPAITVNGVSQTVGIRGVENPTEFDWYWNKGSTELSQKNSATPLISTQKLTVVYRGLFPILVYVRDDTEILNRNLVEGGSGLYESIEEENSITNSDMALNSAVSFLRANGMIARTVEIETLSPGLFAGQLLPISEPRLGLSGTFLIQSVEAADFDGKYFTYSVTALSGEAVGGWLEFFRKLLSLRREKLRGENESTILLRNVSRTDTMTLSDDLDTPVTGTKETRINRAHIGHSVIGVTP